jgi:hypothetical protein
MRKVNPIAPLVILALISLVSIWPRDIAFSQQQASADSADVAAYQLGVIAEAVPGSNINYVLTLTNFGPAPVNSFYLLDGWSVNAEGISAFAGPINDPEFGKFKVEGRWQQQRKDENVFAWLLKGDLLPGDTIRFVWPIRVSNDYSGQLVNWARILTSGIPDGTWQPRTGTTANPPQIESAKDPADTNNRTPDGLTTVTKAPTGQGVDMAVFQTGMLAQIKVGQPMRSTLLVTNLGPQSVKQFYLAAGTSLGADGKSIYQTPVPEPNFGDFKVIGRWVQLRKDEQVWLWLLEGTLEAGGSVILDWSRPILPTYRGDLVNWAAVSVGPVPLDNWTPKGETSAQPEPLATGPDTNPKNDRTTDDLATVVE